LDILVKSVLITGGSSDTKLAAIVIIIIIIINFMLVKLKSLTN